MSRHRGSCVCRQVVITLFLLLPVCNLAWPQETVFSLLKSQVQLADQYYDDKNYRKALEIYWNLFRKEKRPGNLRLKMGKCYYYLKEYKQAVAVLEPFVRSKADLSARDQYLYAECQAAAGNYDKASEAYKNYLKRVPDDQTVIQKVWRLDNLQFLYEDSLHYAVRSMPLNTTAGELCPVPFNSGIIFTSNRKDVQIVEAVDASRSPFYKIYFAPSTYDSLQGFLKYGKAVPFSKGLFSDLHTSRVSFYGNGKKMVFASTGDETARDGVRNLQLYFAEETRTGAWELTGGFAHNNKDYSFTDPAINNNGTVLYFVSDMPGGQGGKDIYRSQLRHGNWTGPENLGDAINTPFDETFPFFHPDNTLYFSSNGQAGMGGLDIFKSRFLEGKWEEVVNLGYPMNSSLDDFGIIIDSLSIHGYFSSNRENAGFDDDLYEFDMDLQTYPLVINGIIRMKEHSWNDSSALEPVSRARLLVVDNIKEITVHESQTDDQGHFSISIPYFSKYKIRIIGSDEEEHIVSLEIPKHRKINSAHEIVIVKDIFQSK